MGTLLRGGGLHVLHCDTAHIFKHSSLLQSVILDYNNSLKVVTWGSRATFLHEGSPFFESLHHRDLHLFHFGENVWSLSRLRCNHLYMGATSLKMQFTADASKCLSRLGWHYLFNSAHSEGGYGINIQVEKYDNREIHGMRFKSTILNICG